MSPCEHDTPYVSRRVVKLSLLLVKLQRGLANNLMKLGGSLGIVPQKLKKTSYKNSTYFKLLVHFQEYNLYHNYIFLYIHIYCFSIRADVEME
jgi:hypothetical protein